jgi:hypothetical protein
VTEDQFKAMLAAAGSPIGESVGPAAPPAQGELDADATITTTSASLTLNGNNPATWPLGTAWSDNLGALFTHAGQSETIYSTSTVDTTQAGTTTISYWAVIPSSQQVLHATRDVVIEGAANDTATGTDGATTTSASSTAQ